MSGKGVARRQRPTRSQVVAALREDLVSVARRLQRLKAEHERLERDHGLLVSLCDVLRFLQQPQCHGGGPPPHDDGAELQPAGLRAVLAAEASLLRELSATEYSSDRLLPPAAAAPPERAADGWLEQLSAATDASAPLCPAQDPLLLLRFVLAHPPNDRTAGGGVRDLAGLAQAEQAAAVARLAVQLGRLDALQQGGSGGGGGGGRGGGGGAAAAGQPPAVLPCSPAASASGRGAEPPVAAAADVAADGGAWPDPLAVIRDTQLNFFRLMLALGHEGKEDVYIRSSLAEGEAGATLPAPPMGRYRFAVRSLGLSREQQERLASGFAVFRRLQAPLLEEQRRLAAAMGAAAEDAGPPVPHACTSAHGARLAEATAMAGRLQRLHRKDATLRFCLIGFTFGALSWQQQARLRVLLAPYNPSAATFCAAVTEHTKAQRGT